MQLWGKLACATAGLAAGGPIGALVGGFAGHYFIDREEGDGRVENQVAFTVAVVALGAKMAKATALSPAMRWQPSRRCSRCRKAR